MKRPCEKPTWLDNVPVSKDVPKKEFPTSKLFSSQRFPTLLSDKNEFKCFELLCPPTREPPPKHIWDMVVLLELARSVPLCQTAAFCHPCISALLLRESSSFELLWRDVFFWNRNGGRFGFGARNEVILCTPLKGPVRNLQFFAPNLIGKQKTTTPP